MIRRLGGPHSRFGCFGQQENLVPFLVIERWISQHVASSLYRLCHPSCIANELARDGSVLKVVGPEPALGVSRQDIQRMIRLDW